MFRSFRLKNRASHGSDRLGSSELAECSPSLRLRFCGCVYWQPGVVQQTVPRSYFGGVAVCRVLYLLDLLSARPVSAANESDLRPLVRQDAVVLSRRTR